MENNEDRVEYVLTQQGLIYQGSKDYIISIPWNFGQVSCSLVPLWVGLRLPKDICLPHQVR